MSRSIIPDRTTRKIFKDETGWADFFITRIGLILFAAMLLLSAFRVYPMFYEHETGAYMDAVISEVAAKIEAVDTTTIPEHKYIYSFDEKNRNVRIEISTEYVAARGNLSSWRDKELVHAKPLATYVYPSNSKWGNTSGLREYLSRRNNFSKNGADSSPLNFSRDKGDVEEMFENIRSELARDPFVVDPDKPLIIEKVIIHYTDQMGGAKRDYVLVYQ
ncbi:MAG: hypothetical protein FIB08_09625 [Candidatus Methanoperedens sp.]|nr:hypothetical protein [Candidatus Methanoperedens sp.]